MVEKISIYPATLLYSNGQSNWFPDYFIIIIIIIIIIIVFLLTFWCFL